MEIGLAQLCVCCGVKKDDVFKVCEDRQMFD